ncbi:MAG: thermonuclease family protein [Thermoleophilaceae bacterium]|nr:thermonuclease family protein [Thermoleophilaceae bacterium]
MEQRSTVRVERVIDGDTVVVSRVGTMRLIGVNAPEEGRCGDDAATRFTRRRLKDKRVEYELGEDRRDRWGRTLAYLRRGDTMHNRALIEEGYAKALTIPPNDKYADRFEAAEEKAKQRDEGPQADCAQKRQEVALGRARANERAERAEQAERLARRVRAAERRVKRQQRRDRGDRGDRGGAGGGGSSAARAPKNCSGVSGPIPTPPRDPNNLDVDNDGQACE